MAPHSQSMESPHQQNDRRQQNTDDPAGDAVVIDAARVPTAAADTHRHTQGHRRRYNPYWQDPHPATWHRCAGTTADMHSARSGLELWRGRHRRPERRHSRAGGHLHEARHRPLWARCSGLSGRWCRSQYLDGATGVGGRLSAIFSGLCGG